MGAALERNQTRYAPSSGIPELRRAILEKARGRNGIPCDDESAVVVNGGMQGLFAAFATLLDPGDEVLMFSPYWTPIMDLIAYHQAKAVLVPTDAARKEGLAKALARRTTSKTKVLYWNCSQQSDRRRLLAPRGRRSRRIRAAQQPRRDLGRSVRGPDLRGRAERRHRVAAGDVRADHHGVHALQELLDDRLAPRLRDRPGALPVGGEDRRALQHQRRLDADAVGRGRGALARHRVRRPSGRPGTAPGATVSSRASRPPGSSSNPRAPPSTSFRSSRRGSARTRARPRARCSTRRRSPPSPASSSAPRAKATCASRSPCPTR